MSRPDPHQQPVDDRQRERKTQRGGCPFPGLARDLHRPPQTLHAAPNHVHSHATPGDVRYLARGGKPGRQDQFQDFRLGKPRVGVDESLLDRALTDGLRVYAAPVVSYPNQHVGAGMLGR